ncbi:MAG: hypothetical protein HRU38_13350 [Saccharospirillaceae bacterium]|nr:hypothetical protein [Pseudomonadales bacterium]NRB79630.1 hypothetical protein [Saccharospirillaceae bacterium]
MKITYYITLLFLLSCNGSDSKSTLEGKWVLNVNETFSQLGDVELSIGIKNGIQNSSNDMTYIFQGNKTTYTPKDSKQNKIEWFKWKLISESNKEIEIKVDGKYYLTFIKHKNCIGLPVEKYSYIEYYCFAL